MKERSQFSLFQTLTLCKGRVCGLWWVARNVICRTYKLSISFESTEPEICGTRPVLRCERSREGQFQASGMGARKGRLSGTLESVSGCSIGNQPRRAALGINGRGDVARQLSPKGEWARAALHWHRATLLARDPSASVQRVAI